MQFLAALVASLLVLQVALVDSACLLPNETVSGLRTDIPSIRFGIADWMASRLNYEVVKIILEEKMGIPTLTHDTLMPGNEEVYLYIQNNSIDAYLELWDAEGDPTFNLYTNTKKTVVAGGLLGVVGRVGFFVPNYLTQVSRSLANYNAYYFSDVINLFNLPEITNTTKLSTYSLDQAKVDLQVALNSWACNNAVGSNATLSACKTKVDSVVAIISNVTSSSNNRTIPFNAPPWDWFDPQVITNLGLNFSLTIFDDPEVNLINAAVAGYHAKKPFVTYLWKPHGIFSEFSGVVFDRIQLPEYTDACAERYYSGHYDCDYIINYLQKLFNPKLQTSNLKAYQLLRQFSYTASDQEYMMGLVKFANYSEQDAACQWVRNNRAVWEAYLPPDYNVIVLPASASEGVRIFFNVLAAILILASAIFCGHMITNRAIRVFQSASVPFLGLILLGSVVSYVYIFLLFDTDPDTLNCQARVWVRHLGFMITFIPLFLKTYRIVWIFNAKTTKSQMKLKDSDLLRKFFEMVVLFSGFLVAWTVSSPSKPIQVVTKTEIFNECATDWWENGILIFELACLLYGVYLCWSVRKAPSAFNESRHVSIAIYNWVLLGVLLQIILQSVSGSPTFRYVLNALQILLTVPVVIFLLFFPKTYLTYKGKGNDVNTSALPKSTRSRSSDNQRIPDKDSFHENKTEEAHEMAENPTVTDDDTSNDEARRSTQSNANSKLPVWV